MGILSQCYACGAHVKHGDLYVGAGLELFCEPPWRMRYAARTNGGHAGRSIVILCSDVCEEIYGKQIGFAPE